MRRFKKQAASENDRKKGLSIWLMVGFAFCLPWAAWGRTAALTETQGQSSAQVEQVPTGKVLFSRDPAKDSMPVKANSETPAREITPAVTDAEREVVSITAYDLDVHLKPSTAGLVARVGMTVRNDGNTPLTRFMLQISSTLRWESLTGGARGKLEFATETVETDADHTGLVSEAVVRLVEPLAPGGTLEVVGVYSGTIERSSARLKRIGAPPDQARMADWDEIGGTSTALRGFGEVLWYPVASAPVFLGDGARFFQAIGRARSAGLTARVRLRLAVEYVGEAPHSAYFLGRMERMTAHSENQDVPVGEAPGIATAEFGAAMVGFGMPSLFVTDKAETVGEGGLLTAVTEDEGAFGSYVAAGRMVQPMLANWYGAEGPVEPMRMIDHVGQPFVEGAFVVAELRKETPEGLASEMLDGLSHAWMRSGRPWIEEGLGQFFRLLWMERTAGREKAVEELQRSAVPLALAPLLEQSLVQARDEVYVRTKAAAVWWMLRSILGDEGLKAGLRAYRLQIRGEAHGTEDARLLQRVLEQKTGASLEWFFDDWVYADKGLPDLSIVQVTPRELPAKGGKGQGWLVAVAVRNDGDAVADVPVTVRSGTLTTTERLRIAGRSTASTRILFEKTPEEIQVNDGEVPEVRTSLHVRRIAVTDR